MNNKIINIPKNKVGGGSYKILINNDIINNINKFEINYKILKKFLLLSITENNKKEDIIFYYLQIFDLFSFLNLNKINKDKHNIKFNINLLFTYFENINNNSFDYQIKRLKNEFNIDKEINKSLLFLYECLIKKKINKKYDINNLINLVIIELENYKKINKTKLIKTNINNIKKPDYNKFKILFQNKYKEININNINHNNILKINKNKLLNNIYNIEIIRFIDYNIKYLILLNNKLKNYLLELEIYYIQIINEIYYISKQI